MQTVSETDTKRKKAGQDRANRHEVGQTSGILEKEKPQALNLEAFAALLCTLARNRQTLKRNSYKCLIIQKIIGKRY